MALITSSHKRSQGQHISGRIPYGYRLAEDGIALVEEPEEQKAATLIRRLRAEGQTTGQIERALQAQDLRPRHGWHWHPKVILELGRREG